MKISCLYNESQDPINLAFVDRDISEEQCDYLYDKYIWGNGEDGFTNIYSYDKLLLQKEQIFEKIVENV